MHPTPIRSNRYLAPALVCCILGLTLVLQVRTNTLRVSIETRAPETTVEQLVQVTREHLKLLEEHRYLKGLASQHATQAALRAELNLELATAGLVEVAGPGVSVSMGGSPANPRDISRVEPEDVLAVLNELKAAGAEAMSVNGIRVNDRFAATAGPSRSILLNGVTAAGPIVVLAVGDPAVLTASLNLRGGVVATLHRFYPVTVAEAPSLIIPAATAPAPLKYARPAR